MSISEFLNNASAEKRNINVSVNENKNSFFFFGCWNKNRNATSDIIETAKTKNYNFGVVCGDNVYPNKDKSGNKYAKIEDIKNGFDILKEYNNPIYIGLGNHEVDTHHPCQALIDELKETNGSNIVMPNNYYSINVINSTNNTLVQKIIMLDTNLMEKNKCYGEDKIDDTNQNLMKDWLKSELELCENTTPIVAGHFPLFYYKFDGDIYEFKMSTKMIDIYKILKEYRKPIYYVCADIHNYQYIISDNISQYIVGTGGADQDQIMESSEIFQVMHKINETDTVFNIIRCSQSYGHVCFDVENNILSGEFIPSQITPYVKPKIKKNKTINDDHV
jgi:hypothetical protein